MSTTLSNIITHLQETEKLYDHMSANNLTDSVKQLQLWQTQRLLATHDDLWQVKRFKPAMQFFIDELYGPKDFSERDKELARVVPKMASILPNKALISLEAALELNSLSLSLDITLAEHLSHSREGGNLTPLKLNRTSYFQAYQQSNNQTQREHQINLLETLGVDLAQVVKISGISTILMLSRKPAKVAGVKSLHEFLESGFKAFKKLGKVDDFIVPIITKERQMMNDLFSAKGQDDNPLPVVPGSIGNL